LPKHSTYFIANCLHNHVIDNLDVYRHTSEISCIPIYNQREWRFVTGKEENELVMSEGRKGGGRLGALIWFDREENNT
jgi:hypothetical protein